MTTEELLRRVRRIEIKTRALTDNVLTGAYHSAFKGRGMAFAEVREYQVGDDVRDIDWNVTARTGRPHVKVYEEERELSVMLLFDVSASGIFGTQERSVQELAAEIGATLAFSALRTGDRVGALLFSDRVEKFIPPQKSSRHILRILHELLTYRPTSRRTNVGAALEYLLHVLPKRSIAFVLSDFIDAQDYDRPLRVAARKHDVVALRLYDPRQATLPDVGLLRVQDAETGHTTYIDTASPHLRAQHHRWFLEETERLHQRFARAGVRYVDVATNDDYVAALRRLFR